ncbi:Pro-kumamolisin, activation domain-containing protein [Xylariaceae sp. FL1272]|nr:Pro-kumamolisin, activation domain-containing protein [Xylariaceae sp. FL1272]
MAPILSFLAGSLLAIQALAQPFDQLFAIPEGWKLQAPAANSQVLRLKIALQQGDAAGFEQAVLDMSTPSHPNYGQHFQSHDEMKRMLMPKSDSVASVYTWLQNAGVEEIEQDADWISFKTTVGAANKMLDTQFAWYVSEGANPQRILRTLEYSVPNVVADHIALVTPTTRFAGLKANHGIGSELESIELIGAAAPITANCETRISPQCLTELYDIDYTPNPKSGSTVAFASYLEEYARYNDLTLFQENILQADIGQNFSVVQFNGGLNDQTSDDDSGEANLDAQYIIGMAHPLPTTECK